MFQFGATLGSTPEATRARTLHETAGPKFSRGLGRHITTPLRTRTDRPPGGASDVLKHCKHRSRASQHLQTRNQNSDQPNSFIKKSKIVRIPESSARLEGTAAEQTTNLGGWAPLPISLSCISLLLEALRDPYQQSLVYNLSGSDAQLMADYLDVVSGEGNALPNNQRKRALYLLGKLATLSQVFPRCYELEIGCDPDMELVGGGGFSDIYRVKRGDWSVCLKMIRVCRKPLEIAGRELALWAHLSHPHILPLYGICTLPRVCFVSPWMKNGNLRNYLAKFPQKPRMPLISDIIDGLVYLHDLGIVHSDLKAENILVSDGGRALITDFGVSSIATSTQFMSVTLHGGTAHWMAPELLLAESGEVRATKACDIWSFACLCYEVFTHKIPFYQYHRDPQVVLALVRKEVPLRQDPGIGCEKIDERVWELLMKCWNYSPQDRPSCETVRGIIKDMRNFQPVRMPGGGLILR